MVLPSNNKDLPWTGVAGGMWIVMIYYCGLNQFIVQRNLAAKSLKHGQLGMIFAGALWLLVPFAMVMPGLMAQQLYGGELGTKTDAAFPTMVTKLIQPGIRGFIYAAIAGAVTSTLASLLNSASTISTMDLYGRMCNRSASQSRLVWLGRILTLIFVIAGCCIAPVLDDPRFGGVFQYIQQFQGYIWPGVVAAFIMPFILPRIPGAAGVAALLIGPVAYGIFQFTERTKDRPTGIHEIHFLLQVLFSFIIVALVMTLMTLTSPLAKAKVLPVRQEISEQTEPVVKIAGGLVIVGVVLFFIAFW
jgi:solute:Na+ symporter, SSS family